MTETTTIDAPAPDATPEDATPAPAPVEAPADAPAPEPAPAPAPAPEPAAPSSGKSWATPPPPPPSWDTRTHLGATCLIAVHKHSTGVLTQHGVKSCVDVTIIELAGPNPGMIFENEALYNVQLVGQLQGLVGQYTLGRFALGQGKGNQPPIVLLPPVGQDDALAEQWFAANPGKMAELQASGKLAADQPKPPPQQNQWQQPGPMQGQQWQNSPTNGYGQPPQNAWGGQQQPPPYPWNGQQGQQQAPPQQQWGQQQGQPQQAWEQPAASGWQAPPPVTQESPPF